MVVGGLLTYKKFDVLTSKNITWLKWTYGHSFKDYGVVTLSKAYPKTDRLTLIIEKHRFKNQLFK